VTSVSGQRFLASMPSRFRRNVWIKRGDFVVLERISEGIKVQAEIVRILYKDHIEQLKKDGLWPSEFSTEESKCQEEDKSDSDSDLFVNTNRRPVQTTDSSESDTESSDESEAKPDN
jgi:probable RNA-binding protein EIF1AD